jgi:hypothetical protein
MNIQIDSPLYRLYIHRTAGYGWILTDGCSAVSMGTIELKQKIDGPLIRKVPIYLPGDSVDSAVNVLKTRIRQDNDIFGVSLTSLAIDN